MVEGRAQLSQAKRESQLPPATVYGHLPTRPCTPPGLKLASAQLRERRVGEKRNRRDLEPKLAYVNLSRISRI